MASFGNVTPGHTFLRSIGHQGRGIGINDGTVENVEATEELTPQFVVGRLQAAQGHRAKAQQESPQRIAMGEITQPQERRNESVVNQTLGVFDATQTYHNGKDVGQKQVGGMKVTVIVIGPAYVGLQEATNCKTPAKGLKETEASKARQPAVYKGKIEFSRTFGHVAQMYPKGTFVQNPNESA